MSPKQQLNIRLDVEQRERLQRVRERVGIPVSEQIRRAINAWLDEHEPDDMKTARPRSAKR